MANGTVNPVVDIAAADTRELRVDNDIVWRLELRNWSVFELYAASFLEDEREILIVVF